MATRNSARYLPAALKSIGPSLAEVDCETEIILADGASTDETVAIALAHPSVRVVSRSDAGIYDGMNRALAAVSGDYVLILNSDDVLPSRALGNALTQLEMHPACDFVSGQALFGIEFETAKLRVHDGPLTQEGAMFGIPAINARLYRASLLRRLGPIRTELGLAADREWMARLAASGSRGGFFNAPLYFYRVHEGSHTISGDRKGRERVYRAEEQLALGLLEAAAAESAETIKLARRSLAVARLKLGLTGSIDRHLNSIGIFDLIAGLVRARRWRGRLSGF
jgi:glycosyltransferase involved in cell wall biosynthesis